ncbi:Condensin complex subunit 3 [Yarrowia sp. C11]|nr:Condensin complex subunit 3 [Yarrowia sp. C11]KAG5364708.1 Condensin complex subunit 3 [Yarrowia sp. E02]
MTTAKQTHVGIKAHNRNEAKLYSLLGQYFQEAQRSLVAQRKIIVSMHQLHEGAVQWNMEEQFTRKFLLLVNRMLSCKKGDKSADRIVELIGSYVLRLQEEEEENREEEEEREEDSDEEQSTISSRFCEALIRHVLRGTQAKDRHVRFRCCHILSTVINSLSDIDDDLFEDLRDSMFARSYDKDANTRLKAVLALCRIQSSSSEEGDTEGGEDTAEEKQLQELLLSLIQNDPSADVRRAILFNLKVTKKTLPYLLERARDTNAITRRSVYGRTMKNIGDFRMLRIGMREKLLQWGLKDRDTGVEQAATKMLVSQWLETCGGSVQELLQRLDVLNSSVSETAVELIFEQKPQMVSNLSFKDSWDSLTPETAFLARVYAQYCLKKGYDDLLDAQVPEVTKIAFFIERDLQNLTVDEEGYSEREFVLEQLLLLAQQLDFGDEIGRRKIVDVLTNALTNKDLSDTLVSAVVNVFHKLCTRERDFIQVLVEIVVDIEDIARESEDPDRVLSTTLRCLAITQTVLEQVETSLESNVELSGLLDSLVLPSVRSHVITIRERGLRCLGLLSLLSREQASDNLMVFGHCVHKGEAEFKVEALKIMSDILVLHGRSVLDLPDKVDSESVHKLYYQALKNADIPELQAVAAEGLFKLLLCGVFSNADLLAGILLNYFDPQSASNGALKQVLSFCIPVYAYSRDENQQVLGSVAIPAIDRILRHLEDIDDDPLTGATAMMQQVLDWTDPRRVVSITNQSSTETKSRVHYDLAFDILSFLGECHERAEHRAYTSALTKLYFPALTAEELTKLKGAVEECHEKISGVDSVSMNAFNRFVASIESLEPVGGEKEGEKEAGEGEEDDKGEKEEGEEGEKEEADGTVLRHTVPEDEDALEAPEYPEDEEAGNTSVRGSLGGRVSGGRVSGGRVSLGGSPLARGSLGSPFRGASMSSTPLGRGSLGGSGSRASFAGSPLGRVSLGSQSGSQIGSPMGRRQSRLSTVSGIDYEAEEEEEEESDEDEEESEESDVEMGM